MPEAWRTTRRSISWWSTTCPRSCWRSESLCWRTGAEHRHGAFGRAKPAASCWSSEFAVILLDVNMPEHGRLRDGGADPAAGSERAHADHLHHGLQRRDAHGPGLLAGRGRLHSVAGRARGAADQGRRLRRSVPQDRSRSRGRRTSGWRWPTSRRRAPRPRRRRALALPGRGEHAWRARSTSRRRVRDLARLGGPLPGRPRPPSPSSTSRAGLRSRAGLDGAAGAERRAHGGSGPTRPPDPPSRSRAPRARHAAEREIRLDGTARSRALGGRCADGPAAPLRTIVHPAAAARGRTLGALMLALAAVARRGSARRPGPGRGPRRPGRHRPGQRPALPATSRRTTAARTSSWRCSPTSCATRWRRSATPSTSCADRRRPTPDARLGRAT